MGSVRRLGVALVSVAVMLTMSATPASSDDQALDGAEVKSGEVDPRGPQTDAGRSPFDARLMNPSGRQRDERGLPADSSDGYWTAFSPKQEAGPAGPSSTTLRRAARREPPPGGGSIPWSRWAACGVRDSRYKVVRDYGRPQLHRRMDRGYARLYCGRRDSVKGGERSSAIATSRTATRTNGRSRLRRWAEVGKIWSAG